MRNAGTWSEAKYWGTLRSGLRRLFRFWQPAQDALRGVVREVLARVQREGLPGEHHLYIAFDTGADGVSVISALSLAPDPTAAANAMRAVVDDALAARKRPRGEK